MSELTKEQIQKLSPEHQETLGTLEARRFQKHQELLEQARGSRGHIWGALFICLAGFGSLFVFAGPEQRLLGVFILFFAVVLTQFRVACVNRRLDALMELLEADLKEVSRKRSG